MDRRNWNYEYFANCSIVTCIICILIIIELIIILPVYFNVKQNDGNKIHRNMDDIVDNIIKTIDYQVEKYKYFLIKTAAVFRQFGIYLTYETYSDLLRYDFPFISDNAESVLWVPKIANSQLNYYQDFYRGNYINNFTVTEVNTTSLTLIPVSRTRELYWPITFYDAGYNKFINQLLIGFDLNSFPLTQTLLNTSLTHEFTSWVRTVLIQQPLENPNNFGVIINKLVFKQLNATKLLDIDNVLGTIGIILRIGELSDFSVKTLDLSINRKDIDMFFFDVTNDGIANNKSLNNSLLYKENKKKYSNIWFMDDVTGFNSVIYRNCTFIDRTWAIYFKFSSHYKNSKRSNVSTIVLVVLVPVFCLLNIICAILFEFGYGLWKYMEIKRRKEQEKNVIASQMLNYVNHEIRNPLNVISGLINYILDVLKPYNARLSRTSVQDTSIKIEHDIYVSVVSDLSTIAGACGMLEHIVTDILDIRKLESGKLELDNKNVKMDDFIRDLVKTIVQKINEKPELEFKQIYDKDLIIYIDPYRLKQILLNYLTNAVKYTDKGSIIIQVVSDSSKTRFSVIDTGRGIRDDCKHKIFQPFTQAMPEDATRYGGVGLGLHLCHMLAKHMGGDVGFVSKINEGSMFWLEFNTNHIKPRDDIV